MKKLVLILTLLLPVAVFGSSASTSMGDSSCATGAYGCSYGYLTAEKATFPTGGVCGDSVTPCTQDSECSPEVCEAKGCEIEKDETTGVLKRIKCPYLEATTDAGARCAWFATHLKNNYDADEHDLQFFMETNATGRVCWNVYIRTLKDGVADWDSQFDYQFAEGTSVGGSASFTANDSKLIDLPVVIPRVNPSNTICPADGCKDTDVYVGVCRVMDRTGVFCATTAPGQSTGDLYIYPGRIQYPFTQ